MKVHLRLSEPNMSEEQIRSRDKTYEAAAVLRRNGFDCEVVEYFVVRHTDTVASIVLK